MPIFEIEKVTTHVGCEDEGGAGETRTLEVEGPAADGRFNRARFVFGARCAAPVVGYLTRAGVAGVSLVGWLPAAAFGAFRDAAAAGGPLQVQYETRDPTSGYLRRLGLGQLHAAPVAVAVPVQPRSPEHRQGPPARAFAMPL